MINVHYFVDIIIASHPLFGAIFINLISQMSKYLQELSAFFMFHLFLNKPAHSSYSSNLLQVGFCWSPYNSIS